MKTILLVDDEFPARQLVKSMLDWEQAGFRIAHEAKNGAEALEVYRAHKPDLIISDIQMPVMDGLALLSAIRKEDTQQPFIILSCFERFDYARQVIRLGGLDYLIKDTLTPEILFTSLQQVNDRLDPDAKAPPPRSETPLAPAPFSLVLEQWLHTGDDEEAVRQLQSLLPAKDARFMLASVGVHPPEGEPPIAEELKQHLEAAADFSPQWGCAVPGPGTILLFFLLPPKQQDEHRQRYTLLQQAKSLLETCTKSPVTLGVSAVHTNPAHLPQARIESEDALRYRLFMGSGSILYFSPLQNASHAVRHRHLEMRITTLRSAIANEDVAAVKESLDKLYHTDLYGVMQLNYLEQLNSILWGILTEERMLRGQLATPSELDFKTPADISQLNSEAEMGTAFFQLLGGLIGTEPRQTGANYSQRVRHVIQYIDEHLHEDIGLEVIAEEFQIHKAHLARTFKDETGAGLHEFIRQSRIEAAKKLLLNSQYRVNEIVYKVGFKNPQNFYTLFTKYVGLTPKAFRDTYG